MQGTGLCVGDSPCSGPTHRPAPAEILPLEQQEKSISFKNVIEVKCVEQNYDDSQKIEASLHVMGCSILGAYAQTGHRQKK